MIYEHKVQYYETDAMKIVHHSNYIRWMEEARVYFLEQIGWPLEKLEEEGLVIPVRSVSCEYVNMTRFGDRVKIAAILEEFGGVKMAVSYVMMNAESGELLCRAKSTHCFLKDGRIINLRKKYPQAYEAFEKQIGIDSELL